jgi:Holliday junction resolvase
VNIRRRRAAPKPHVSEAEFQAGVEKLLTLHGYDWWHDRDSRLNKAGLPDILAIRDDRLVVIECKSESGRVRPEQDRWLRLFAGVRRVEVAVARPSDDWSQLEAWLR